MSPRQPEDTEALRLTVAANVRAARLGKRMTQVNLGTAMGCNHSSIAQIERGASLPSLPMLWRLARALDTTVGALAGDPR